MNLNNIESSSLHIFYNIQKYNIIPSFTKHFEIIVAATLGKTMGPPMPKLSNNTHLREKQEPYKTCTLSMTSQINVVKSNLFHHLTDITYF